MMDKKSMDPIITKEEFLVQALYWRSIEPEDACDECGGSGVKAYGSTTTWRSGVGGQMMTTGVCNKCWGSGNKHQPWVNLKTLKHG